MKSKDVDSLVRERPANFPERTCAIFEVCGEFFGDGHGRDLPDLSEKCGTHPV
jgi:hypothetical protein